MRKNGLHPGPPWRPLPGSLSAYRCPLPDHRAQQNLQAVPLALDGPWGLCARPRWAPSRLPASVLPGVSGRANTFLINDCLASTALTKKKDMLSELAFSGRHANQSIWVLTQKYNAVLKDLKDLCEQTRWVCLIHCKDRDSFDEACRENDAIPAREQCALVRQRLAEKTR